MRVMGIDEAGRGCVLGALVIAAFVVDDVEDAVLREAGANDSKKLSAKRRVAARERLQPLGTADVRLVHATAIDGGNLNTLEEATIAALVREHRPDAVFVDALGHPSAIPRAIQRLQALCGSEVCPSWVMEPKADGTYPVVGAASIFAKTTRDARLHELEATYGALGSGYPSDPKTKAWLQQWARAAEPWPPFVRTRWATIQNLAQLSL